MRTSIRLHISEDSDLILPSGMSLHNIVSSGYSVSNCNLMNLLIHHSFSWLFSYFCRWSISDFKQQPTLHFCSRILLLSSSYDFVHFYNRSFTSVLLLLCHHLSKQTHKNPITCVSQPLLIPHTLTALSIFLLSSWENLFKSCLKGNELLLPPFPHIMSPF